MNSKKLIITYLVFLHIAFAFVILKTDFIPKLEDKLGILPEELTLFYHDMMSIHDSMDGNLPDNTTVFIGDSITQGLAVSAVATPSANYGIGLDTTFGVLQRISQYKSLQTANAVVLAIGFNDLKRRKNEEILKNYREILALIPKHTRIVISGILPIDERVKDVTGNSRIGEINASLEEISKQFKNVTFVDATDELLDSSKNLAEKYHTGDGIHLSTEGYKVWIKYLKKLLITKSGFM